MRDLDVSGQTPEIEPAKIPGRTTRVEAEAGRGPAAAAGPGKRTLVSDASDGFESAVADAKRYARILEAALTGPDRSAAKQAASSLESALGTLREVASNGAATARMHETIEVFVHAEPLLARARGSV
jgi:hypothetical protein